MSDLFLIFGLLVAFQVKHFIADYPLQTPYMLGKMQRVNWIKPLMAHAAVHAFLTFLIVLLIQPSNYFLYFFLPLADFSIHFIVDRLKASPKIGGRFKPNQPYFWWALGADQMARHLTHYLFIFIIISIL